MSCAGNEWNVSCLWLNNQLTGGDRRDLETVGNAHLLSTWWHSEIQKLGII